MNTFITHPWGIIEPWLLNNGIKILAIVVGALILPRIARVFIEKGVRHSVIGHRHEESAEAKRKREDTLIGVFTGSLVVVIWVMAIMMIIAEFGVNIGPVLAAAGVAGVALGFGAQWLVRDVISGLFIIFENQFRVGDVVCVGSTCGVVESIDLRHTVLRDMDGTAHHVPNGQIAIASNMSKHFSKVNLNVGVSYDADIKKVVEVVNRVGKEIADDPAWKDSLVSTPKFLRIDDFADSSIVIKIVADTKPIRQWDVTAELRMRLKLAFDKEGIEIPFPQRVIHEAKH